MQLFVKLVNKKETNKKKKDKNEFLGTRERSMGQSINGWFKATWLLLSARLIIVFATFRAKDSLLYLHAQWKLVLDLLDTWKTTRRPVPSYAYLSAKFQVFDQGRTQNKLFHVFLLHSYFFFFKKKQQTNTMGLFKNHNFVLLFFCWISFFKWHIRERNCEIAACLKMPEEK